MLRVFCHTNLDLSGEKWPTQLPALPNVGDIIQSETKWKEFQLELEVRRISWKFNDSIGVYVPHIELHMTKWQGMLTSKKEGAAQGSITAFYEWYAPLVGRSVGAFI